MAPKSDQVATKEDLNQLEKRLEKTIKKAVDFLVETLGGMILDNRGMILDNKRAIESLERGQTDIKRQLNDLKTDTPTQKEFNQLKERVDHFLTS